MSKPKSLRVQQIVIFVLMTIVISVIVFFGYRPVSYDLEIGSVCNSDIFASRSFTDTYQTRYEAVLAKNSVRAVFVRSESVSAQSVTDTETFFAEAMTLRESRNNNEEDTPVAFNQLYESFNNTTSDLYNGIVSSDEFHNLIFMSPSAFNLLSDKACSIAEIIMMDNINYDMLVTAIDSQIEVFEGSYPDYAVYADTLRSILNLTITPNSVFDKGATDESGDNAYLEAMNNPVIVEKGTRIISSGDVVDEHAYQCLKDLELIRSDSSDFIIFARILFYIAVLMILLAAYINNSHLVKVFNLRMTIMMVISFIIPIGVAWYLAKISTVMIVVLFFTTISSTYLGVSSGIILALINVLMAWPLYSFDDKYLVISTIGIVVSSIFAGKQTRKSNSAQVILVPLLASLIACSCINLIMGLSRKDFVESLVLVAVSVAFSIIVAIGVMPIYELFSNTVTPVKLIELSDPGHPLLKKMSIEIPGTYSHSMMVANLADAAAEAIGADALLCKVASYYHDIGKLENPFYFTENQSDGYNPHDLLTTEESAAIILSHTTNGVELAHKHHLPEAIINIINEHHGTTQAGYFYNKAKNAAKEQGLPEPDASIYTYKGNVPSTRESAIIMIADTCEAAVRSSKYTKIEDIEPFVRKLIKGKINEDQFTNSGLSFEDIENIIRAFLRIYAGANHERIQYPDAN